MDKNSMKVGNRYNWKHQPDRLIYLGKKGSWHQFKKIGDPRRARAVPNPHPTQG